MFPKFHTSLFYSKKYNTRNFTPFLCTHSIFISIQIYENLSFLLCSKVVDIKRFLKMNRVHKSSLSSSKVLRKLQYYRRVYCLNTLQLIKATVFCDIISYLTLVIISTLEKKIWAFEKREM